jgi:hypothetical protein
VEDAAAEAVAEDCCADGGFGGRIHIDMVTPGGKSSG